MAVNVILEVKAKPEKVDELKQVLKTILPDTREYQGCMGVKVLLNQDEPLNIVLLENWESRQDYESYLAWRSETGALQKLAELLSQEPNIRYFDNLAI